MKFLPENKKRAVFYLIILTASVAGIIYFVFFVGPSVPSTPPPPPSDEKATGGLLPYGGKIDTRIFKLEKFRALRSAPPVSVSEAELGKSELFLK